MGSGGSWFNVLNCLCSCSIIFLLARDHNLSPFPESVILTGFDFV